MVGLPGHVPAVLRMMLLILTFRPTKIRFRLVSFTTCDLPLVNVNRLCGEVSGSLLAIK